MAFESANFEATLAAAAGEDNALMHELRAAFAASMAQQIDLLKRARCDANWLQSAQKLRSLAASFHCDEVQKLADEAVKTVPGEPGVVRRLEALLKEINAL